LIVTRNVDASASSDARIQSPRGWNQFIRAATGINNVASVSVETVQASL
jgi:hypothetical protein